VPTEREELEAVAVHLERWVGRRWLLDEMPKMAREMRAALRAVRGALESPRDGVLRLPRWGCVVWLGADRGASGDPAILGCELNDYDNAKTPEQAQSGPNAYEISAPESQEILDAINDHFGTAYRWEDFPGR